MIKTKTETQNFKSVITDTIIKIKLKSLIALFCFLIIGLVSNKSYAQCSYDVTCPIITDLGSFDCNQLDQIPDLPTNITTAEAAPYNIDIGDMPCDPITVSAVDDITVDVCVDGGQIITRTVTITDGTNTTDCIFTYNIVEDDTNPFIMCPTAVTLQCVMDIPEPINPVSGQFVRVSLVGPEALSLAEVEVYSAGVNVALTGIASQSSLDFGGLASRAIDGNTDGVYANNSVTHTMNEANPFWIVDLGSEFNIDEIRVFNRTDACCVARLDNYTLEILDDAMNVEYTKGPNPAPDVWHAHFPSYDIVGFDNCVGDLTPSYVGDASDGLICPENVTRTFRLTDACGNFMECEQLFVFDDTRRPAFVDPPENISSDQGMVCGDPIDPHALETAYAEGFPTIRDNCLGMNITPADLVAEIPAPWDGANYVLANGYEIAYTDFIIVHPEGICTEANQRKYRIERTWTITDPCGNTRSSDPEEGGTAFDFQRINVNDGNRNPVPRTLNGVILMTNGSCEVTVNAIDLDAGSTDNCGLYDPNDPSMFDVTTTLMIRVAGSGDPLSPSLTFDMSDFDLSAACPAQISLELWLTDECGNSDFAVTSINIRDNTPPTISCIPDVSGLDCNSILPLPATDYTSFVAMGGAISDECSGTNVTVTSVDNLDPSSFSFCQGDGPFEIERTYTITDECGSVSNCIQILSYESDTDGPTIISCPDNVLLECPAEANDANPVINGQFVRITIPSNEYLSVAEVEVYSAGMNLALTGTATQSSNFSPTTGLADLGNDGNTDGHYFTGMSVTATSNTDAAPFWMVDLGGEFDLDEIRIFNRTDCCPERLNDYTLEVLDASMTPVFTSGPNPAPDTWSTHFLSFNIVASDNCVNEMSIVLIDEQVLPPTKCIAKVMRTYAVIDECGNSSDPCIQEIEIADTTPPVIACPTLIDTIEGCDENAILAATGLAYAPFADGININLFPGTIMEDCQIEDASYSDVITDDMCPNPIFQITRTWTVTDFCGNISNTCSQILVVEDTTPPNFVAPPENITVNQGLTCQDAYDPHTLETRFGEGFPEISDPCLASNILASDLEAEIASPWDGTSITLANDYIISYSDSLVPHPGGLCTEDEQRKYRIYRFWTITDPCGNTMISDPDTGGPGFDFQRINFGDGPTAPTAVAIANPLNIGLTNACNVTIDVNMIENGSFDNCGIDDPNDPSVFDVAATAQIRILNSGDPFTTSLVLDQTDFDLSMACPAQLSIELQVTDECGNTGTSVAVLLISDVTDPVISSCPSPASFEGCDENDITAPHLPYSDVDVDASELDFTSLGGAFTENCSIASVTYRDVLNNSSCPGPTITRTWTITDHCGNAAGCNQTLTINDTTAPSYVDPPNNVSADQGLMCGDEFHPHALEMRFSEGFPEISDPCLATNITPSDLMTEIADPWDGTETMLMNGYSIAYSDNIISHPEGLCTNDEQRKYRINRTWTITDPCGNSMSSDPMVGGTGFDFQRINFGDGPTAPTAVAIMTPLNLDLSATCEVTVDVSDIENGSFDNCGINDINDPSIFDVPSTAVIRILGSGDAFSTSLVINQSDFDLSMGCPANVTIELQVTDECGNTGTTTAALLIEDTMDPMITACPMDASFEGCDEDDIAAPHLPYSDTDEVASEMDFSVIGGSYSENCGIATITYIDVLNTTGCPSPTASISRTWTLTDHCGNVASCSHTLNITDTTAPSYVAPPNNVSIDQGLMCGDAFDPHSLETRFGEGFPEITDPCLSSNITPSDLMTEITEPWDGTEVVLNNDYRISFVDDIVPHPDGLCTTDYQRKYRINRTWTITDPCGNSMSSDPMIGGVGFDFQRINIGDAQNPTAVARDLVVSLMNCTAFLVASDFENGSTDNCGIYDLNDPSDFDVAGTAMIRIKDSGDAFSPTLTVDGTNLDFSLGCSANIIVELMVSDECGNTDVAESMVVVQEFDVPTCVTQDITLYITEPGQIFTVSPQDINDGSFDACSGIASMTVSPNQFDCSNTGVTEVVLTVTDNACNTSSCTANVTLIDATVPVCVVEPEITVSLDGNGMVSVDASQVDDGTYTHCGAGFTIEISPNTFFCTDIGPNTVTFTATTDFGETCQAMAIINVVDNTPPTVNFPPDITVMSQTEIDLDGDNLNMLYGDVNSVMDNCPGEPLIASMVNVRFVSCSENEIVRDWIVYDSSGNSTEGQQIVTVLGPGNSVNPDVDAALCWDAKDDDPSGTVDINGNAKVFYDLGTVSSHNWLIVDDAGLGLTEAANLVNDDTDIVTLDITTVDPTTKFGVFEITMSYQIEDSNDCTSALITFPVSITIPQCGELPWKGN